MIGKIKGKLSEIEGNTGLVETSGGVYYKVFLTPDILQRSGINDPIDIYTYLHVKEDGLTLYGFDDKKKYQLFKMLLNVDGVGPKLAFGIISYTGSDKIINAVTASDYTFFSSVPGVGKKTAQKILLELSGKFDAEFKLEKTILSQDDATVLEALLSLGFDRVSSHSALAKVDKKSRLEAKIQQAIKLMTQK